MFIATKDVHSIDVTEANVCNLLSFFFFKVIEIAKS
jgi:hypothetical protein